MAKDWLFSEGSQAFVQWVRSPQQLIQCPPGAYPSMVCDLTRVRRYEDGSVEVKDLPAVSFPLAELTGEDLADAILIKDAITRMLARRVDPASLLPTPDPEPTPEEQP